MEIPAEGMRLSSLSGKEQISVSAVVSFFNMAHVEMRMTRLITQYRGLQIPMKSHVYWLHLERNIIQKWEACLEFSLSLPWAIGSLRFLLCHDPNSPTLSAFPPFCESLASALPSFCVSGIQHLQCTGSNLFINPPSSRKLLLGGVFVSENLTCFWLARRPAVFRSMSTLWPIAMTRLMQTEHSYPWCWNTTVSCMSYLLSGCSLGSFSKPMLLCLGIKCCVSLELSIWPLSLFLPHFPYIIYNLYHAYGFSSHICAKNFQMCIACLDLFY